MKCEDCGSEMQWRGSMRDGRMECTACYTVGDIKEAWDDAKLNDMIRQQTGGAQRRADIAQQYAANPFAAAPTPTHPDCPYTINLRPDGFVDVCCPACHLTSVVSPTTGDMACHACGKYMDLTLLGYMPLAPNAPTQSSPALKAHRLTLLPSGGMDIVCSKCYGAFRYKSQSYFVNCKNCGASIDTGANPGGIDPDPVSPADSTGVANAFDPAPVLNQAAIGTAIHRAMEEAFQGGKYSEAKFREVYLAELAKLGLV